MFGWCYSSKKLNIMATIQDVPEAPSIKEVVPSKAKENLLGWIKFFKDLSPRIEILIPGDKLFNLEEIEQKTINDFIGNPNANLINWPEKDDVLFILTIDSSFDEKPIFLFPDTYLFCRRDYCFGLDYFQYYSESNVSDNDYRITYDRDCLVWNFIKNLIVKRLKILEESVPELIYPTTNDTPY